MKKYISVIILLICAYPVQSQISINEMDMFSEGVTYDVQSAIIVNRNMYIGESSSNSMEWTIPDISFEVGGVIENVDPASTLFADDFPTAQYAQKMEYKDNMNGAEIRTVIYYEKRGEDLYKLGEGHLYKSNDSEEKFTHKGESRFYPVPIVFGAEYTQEDTSVGPNYMTITTTAAKADAFGKITLPNGAYDALRIKGDVTTKMYYDGNLLPEETYTSYTWQTKGKGWFSVNIDTGGLDNGVGLLEQATLAVASGATGIEDEIAVPLSYSLEQNYPNPFNPETVISFTLPQPGNISLKIYDALGQEVATLANGFSPAGEFSFMFDASGMSSGIYYYTLYDGVTKLTKKMVYLK